MSTPPIFNEPELLRRITNSDENAFRELFDHYQVRLHSYLSLAMRSHAAADDGIQDIFLKLWNRRAQLPDVQNIGHYLQRMARNYAIDQLKFTAREELVAKHIGESEQFGAAADTGLLTEEVRQQIMRLIDQLTPTQRKIFLMTREQGLSHQAIAQQLAISPLTVKRHVSDALQSLRKGLFDEYGPQAIIIFIIWQLQ